MGWSAGRVRAPAWLTRKPIAHRGLHDLAAGLPENTLAAFEAAIRGGYAIELDVRQTASEELVVFHDRDLERATGRAGRVWAQDAVALTRLHVFGSEQTIPTLAETLRFVGGRAPLLIEVKPARDRRRCVRGLVEALSKHAGPVAVQSFDPWLLRELRAVLPGIALGQLAGPFLGGGMPPLRRLALRSLLVLAVSRPDFLAYDIEGLPSARVSAVARGLGLPLIGWTVRSRAQLRVARHCCDNVIFEALWP